jgi:hypothetical protein
MQNKKSNPGYGDSLYCRSVFLALSINSYLIYNRYCKASFTAWVYKSTLGVDLIKDGGYYTQRNLVARDVRIEL